MTTVSDACFSGYSSPLVDNFSFPYHLLMLDIVKHSDFRVSSEDAAGLPSRVR